MINNLTRRGLFSTIFGALAASRLTIPTSVPFTFPPRKINPTTILMSEYYKKRALAQLQKTFTAAALYKNTFSFPSVRSTIRFPYEKLDETNE